MRLRLIPGLIALVASPALATTPGNNVRCIYDQLSAEDREIATIMTMDVLEGPKTNRDGPAAEEVEILVHDPYIFCSDKYPWGYIEIQNAQTYVITRLLSTASTELLLIFGKDPVVIDDYFAQHRVALLKQAHIDDKQLGQFTEHLKNQGWDLAKEEPVALATSYLISLWTLEKLARAFDKSELFDPSDA